MNQNLRRLQHAIAATTQTMSAGDLEWRPAAGRWSSAEILEHLNLTYIGTVRNFDRSLQAGRPLGSTPTLNERLRAMLVVDLGYLPPGRKASKPTIPSGKPAVQVLSEIETNISTMDRVLEESTARFGKKTLIASHPILGPLRVSQWCKFHWVHGRHHLKQILRLRDERARGPSALLAN